MRETAQPSNIGPVLLRGPFLDSSYFAYDLGGHEIQQTDYDGRVTDYVFDALGRETGENWMEGATVVRAMTFRYDLAGEMVSASDPSASYSYTYNDAGYDTSSTASYAGTF
jgi:YD repeat-containing protein